jgi:hypothetical protein
MDGSAELVPKDGPADRNPDNPDIGWFAFPTMDGPVMDIRFTC